MNLKIVQAALTSVLVAAPMALLAENYNESTKWWFLNPVSPNWTCTDTRAACFSAGPNQYSFYGLYMIRRSGTLYAYVQGGGAVGPCAPTGGGDNFCVFKAPDTAQGWTGQGVTLENHWPRPDDGWFWQVRAAFFDATYGKFYLVASRTISGDTQTIDVMDAKLGTSVDGVNFTWSTLFTARKSSIGVRLEDYAIVPHPTHPGVWVGTITGFTLSTSTAFISPFRVDWNSRIIQIADSAGVWRSIPVGGTLNFAPRATYAGRTTSIQAVNVTGVSRLEAWGAEPVSYSAGSGVQNNPCPPGFPSGVATARYLQNRLDLQQLGSSVVSYRHFDPNTLTFTTPWTRITSSVRGLPSDYLWALSWMVYRLDTGGREYVYTGSKDGVICQNALTWNVWAGSGILVTKIDFLP
jgi:hypothetical protein